MRCSAGASLAQACHSGVLTSSLRPLAASPRDSRSRTTASSARAAAADSGAEGPTSGAADSAVNDAHQRGPAAIAVFAGEPALCRRQLQAHATWQAAWPACADVRVMDWPAIAGAALCAMMNPFLDRPVSADGQEKVCDVSGSERWAEPFPRTGGRRSA